MTQFEPMIFISKLKLFSNDKSILFEESFHEGLNIICSSTNSCGKSTLMDSIYHLIGGEVPEWTEAGQKIEFGLLELIINKSVFTFRRERTPKNSAMYIFEGDMVTAEKNSTNWIKYGHKRSEKQKSFSQVIFEFLGFPELKNEQDDNVTFNQILRLIYCDQETSVNKIFKDITFDKEAMRKSVVEILLGADDLELFQLRSDLQILQKKLSDSRGGITALTSTLNEIYKLDDFDSSVFENEAVKIEKEIEKLNIEIQSRLNKPSEKTDSKDDERLNNLKSEIIDLRRDVYRLDSQIEEIVYEIRDSQLFIESLKNRVDSLNISQKVIDLVGAIEFINCPSCLSPISKNVNESCCTLCKSSITNNAIEYNRSKARSEIEFQLNESNQLQTNRNTELKSLTFKKEQLGKKLETFERQIDQIIPVASRIDIEVQSKISKVGYLERKLEDLVKSKQLGKLLDDKIQEKAELTSSVSIVEDKIKYLISSRKEKWDKALMRLSKYVKEILQADLDVEESFKNAKVVEIHFDKNRILVDGNSKFSASSEVILKNALYLSLLRLSLEDSNIKFPRFLLLDNIEDKGMTPERSQNFQNIIYNLCSDFDVSKQVIVTTSMVSPLLEKNELIIGKVYNSNNKTLEI